MISSTSSSRAATPEGYMFQRRAIRLSGSWDDLLDRRRGSSRKGSLGTDSPGRTKLFKARGSGSGSNLLSADSPQKSVQDSCGVTLKLHTPATSPARTSPVGEEASTIKEVRTIMRGDGSVRQKIRIGEGLPENITNDEIQVLAEVALAAANLVRQQSRRSSMGNFNLGSNRSSRRASDGSCKMQHRSPGRSPSTIVRSPNRSLRRDTPGCSADSTRRNMSGSCRLESGSFRLPRHGPQEIPPRDSLKLDTPRRSPSGTFPREFSHSLKVEPRKSPSETFQRETSRSLKVDTPCRSPSTSFAKDITNFLLRSPSTSFKSPSGSFKSPTEIFTVDGHRKGSSGSFKLDAPKRSTSGSFKLGTPRQSPSGSSMRGMEECTCHRRGSSESQVRSRRESQVNAAELDGAASVLQVSPGSGTTETVGSFKIDSSKEGHLIVTQLKAPVNRQPGARPDKLRIVCPLDSNIKIEFKMEDPNQPPPKLIFPDAEKETTEEKKANDQPTPKVPFYRFSGSKKLSLKTPERGSSVRTPEKGSMKLPEKGGSMKIPEKGPMKLSEKGGSMKIPEKAPLKLSEKGGSMRVPEKGGSMRVPEKGSLKLSEKGGSMKVPEKQEKGSIKIPEKPEKGSIKVPEKGSIKTPDKGTPEKSLSKTPEPPQIPDAE